MQAAALRGECTATQAVCKRTFVISTFQMFGFASLRVNTFQGIVDTLKLFPASRQTHEASVYSEGKQERFIKTEKKNILWL